MSYDSDKTQKCLKKSIFEAYWEKMKPINERRKNNLYSKQGLMKIAKKKYKQRMMQELFYKWVL